MTCCTVTENMESSSSQSEKTKTDRKKSSEEKKSHSVSGQTPAQGPREPVESLLWRCSELR